jgi:hypothetical protein
MARNRKKKDGPTTAPAVLEGEAKAREEEERGALEELRAEWVDEATRDLQAVNLTAEDLKPVSRWAKEDRPKSAAEVIELLDRLFHEAVHLELPRLERVVKMGHVLNWAYTHFPKQWKSIKKSLRCSPSQASQARLIAAYWPKLVKRKEFMAAPGVDAARRIAAKIKRDSGAGDGRSSNGRPRNVNAEQQQQQPEALPQTLDADHPALTRPAASGIDWLERGGEVRSFLLGTTRRLEEYLASDAGWPRQVVPVAAALDAAKRCVAAMGLVLHRLRAIEAGKYRPEATEGQPEATDGQPEAKPEGSQGATEGNRNLKPLAWENGENW